MKQANILMTILLFVAIIVFGIYFWKMFVGLLLLIVIVFLGYRVLFNKGTKKKR